MTSTILHTECHRLRDRQGTELIEHILVEPGIIVRGIEIDEVYIDAALAFNKLLNATAVERALFNLKGFQVLFKLL